MYVIVSCNFVRMPTQFTFEMMGMWRNFSAYLWIWWRFNLRFLRSHWLRNSLVVCVLAILCASVNGVWRAAGSSIGSLERSFDSISAQDGLELRAKQGLLNEALLAPVFQEFSFDFGLLPVLELEAELKTETALNRISIWGSLVTTEYENERLVLRADSSLVTKYKNSAPFLNLAGRQFPVVIKEADSGSALLYGARQDLILLPLQWLQTESGLGPKLSKLFVFAQGDELRQIQSGLARISAAVEIEETSSNQGLATKMLAAYRNNVLTLALMALCVALLLVFNVAQMAVLGRERELGYLSLVGIGRYGLFLLILAEIMTLSVLGVGLGTFVGEPLSLALMQMVQSTARALYTLPLTPLDRWLTALFAGLALIVACGCAAVIPARQAASQRGGFGVITNSAQGANAKSWRLLSALVITVLIAVLFSGLAIIKNAVLYAYLSAFAIIAATFILAAFFYRIIIILGSTRVGLAKKLAVPEILALGGLRESYRLSRVASGTLGVALSLCVGISVMVESFRGTLESWINQTFRADLYVKAEKQNLLSPYYLDAELFALLSSHHQVARVSRYSARLVDVQGVPILVGATDFAIGMRAGVYREESGSLEDVISSQGAQIAITESASRKLGLAVGDYAQFWGSKKRVAAIFRDYSSEHGMLLMDYEAYQREFGALAPVSLGGYLKSGSAQELQSELRVLPQFAAVAITQSAALRDLVRRIFVDTFRITDVLEFIVLLMCGLGLLSSSLQRFWQRRHELELAKVLGVTPRMLAVALLLETFAIALPGICAGVIGGLSLSWLLVYLINPLSFGWTIDWSVSIYAVSQPILFSLALVVLVSIVGGRTNSSRDRSSAFSE